jgi:aminoglycoside 6'-N-acetyltransferase
MLRLSTGTDSIHGKPARGVVSLRPATPEDLDLLRRWDAQPHVIAAKGDEDWQWETELARRPDWREQLIAEVHGRPIGYLEIIDPAREESQYWGCIGEGHRALDIWIGEQDSLNRGYGTRMMQLAIERCFADPAVIAILVDPLDRNPRAHRFYERLGFEYVVRRCFGEDSCFVYRLTRPGSPATHA